MEHDRLLELLRALPPAPREWVARAQEIPSLASLEGGYEDDTDGARADVDSTEDRLPGGADSWEPLEDREPEGASPDEPPDDAWLH